MGAQLTEPLTYPSQSYAASFFSTVPRDSRFIKCTFQKFSPTSVVGRTVTFVCQRYESPSVYNFNEACMEVTCSIVKNNGDVPETAKSVSVVNNTLHSLFKSVRIKINDYEITKQPQLYAYRAYIAACLTYSSFCKSAQLQSQGYYADLSSHMGAEGSKFLLLEFASAKLVTALGLSFVFNKW